MTEKLSRRTFAGAPAALMLAGVATLSGCASSRGGTVPYEVQDFGRPDVETIAPVTVDSRISPSDTIAVTVFQVPDLSGDHQVDPNGLITMPLIGQVQAAGKTSDELAKDLQTRLSQRYLRNPNVQVSLKRITEQVVTVDGAVKNPGAFPIRTNTSLQQAIALARGVEGDANIRRVVVFRQINGKRHAAAFDLQAIRRAEAEDPLVFGNDIVVVDRNNTDRWFGRVLASVPLLGIFNPF